MKIVETAILSTDLAMYFKKRNKFLELVENGEFDWQSDDKKECRWQSDLKNWRSLHVFFFCSAMWYDDDSL